MHQKVLNFLHAPLLGLLLIDVALIACNRFRTSLCPLFGGGSESLDKMSLADAAQHFPVCRGFVLCAITLWIGNCLPASPGFTSGSFGACSCAAGNNWTCRKPMARCPGESNGITISNCYLLSCSCLCRLAQDSGGCGKPASIWFHSSSFPCTV